MYKVGLGRGCKSLSGTKAFVETVSSSSSGSVSGASGSGGKDRRMGRRGNGGLRLGRGGMEGGMSASTTSASNGSG
jgi:hypothetical protein